MFRTILTSFAFAAVQAVNLSQPATTTTTNPSMPPAPPPATPSGPETFIPNIPVTHCSQGPNGTCTTTEQDPTDWLKDKVHEGVGKAVGEWQKVPAMQTVVEHMPSRNQVHGAVMGFHDNNLAHAGDWIDGKLSLENVKTGFGAASKPLMQEVGNKLGDMASYVSDVTETVGDLWANTKGEMNAHENLVKNKLKSDFLPVLDQASSQEFADLRDNVFPKVKDLALAGKQFGGRSWDVIRNQIMPNAETYGKEIANSWMTNVMPAVEKWAKNNQDRISKVHKGYDMIEHIAKDLKNKEQAYECEQDACCQWTMPDPCPPSPVSTVTDPWYCFTTPPQPYAKYGCPWDNTNSNGPPTTGPPTTGPPTTGPPTTTTTV